MGKQPVWKGAAGITETSESPKLSDSSQGKVWTRIFQGPYETLKGNIPVRLSTVSGTAGLVDTVNLTKMPGGNGQLVITCTPNPNPSPKTEITSDPPRLEVEWMELQKRIETHKIYQPGGTHALEDSDLQDIDVWKNSGAAERTAKFGALSDNAKHLARKILKGEDSYVIFYPIVRRTTPIGGAPTGSSAGRIEVPPILMDGYTFLKTADRYVDKGNFWSQGEEWTGAEQIDTDLYPGG